MRTGEVTEMSGEDTIRGSKLSTAIIELDAAMRAGRLRYNGDPVLTWCIGNVAGKADRPDAATDKTEGPESRLPCSPPPLSFVVACRAQVSRQGWDEAVRMNTPARYAHLLKPLRDRCALECSGSSLSAASLR
jgi:hypothetical protein